MVWQLLKPVSLEIRIYRKTLTVSRYLEMYAPDYNIVKRRSDNPPQLLKSYLKELNRMDRVIYGTLAKSSRLYRLWRIQTDTTLLDFEKTQKLKLNQVH